MSFANGSASIQMAGGAAGDKKGKKKEQADWRDTNMALVRRSEHRAVASLRATASCIHSVIPTRASCIHSVIPTRFAPCCTAQFGSDIEKKVKAAAADGEPQWDGAGVEVGLQMWRIEQFKVKPWPKNKYGKFHKGDSYIVLNTYVKDPVNNPDKLAWDVHFWIGAESTQDEYGTAAYKVGLAAHCEDGPPATTLQRQPAHRRPPRGEPLAAAAARSLSCCPWPLPRLSACTHASPPCTSPCTDGRARRQAWWRARAAPRGAGERVAALPLVL